MSNSSRYRDRKFVAVLYPEDPTHAECIERLKTQGYTFAAILHDQDVYEDGDKAGELKKRHWHVVLKFKNAVWNESLAKDLGIAPNYLEKAKALDAALLYLVHFGYEEKYQYELENVFGPLQTRLAFLLSDTDESTRALTIYDLIRNSPGVVTYTEIFEKSCKAGLYSDFRRMGSGVMYLISEHNSEFTYKSQRDCDRDRHRAKFDNYCKWTSDKTGDILPLD